MTARFRPGERVRIRGERWRIVRWVPYGSAVVVDVRGCERANHGEQARFLLPFEHVDPLGHLHVPRVVRPRRWRRAARRLLADALPTGPCLPAAARARFDIIPFQLEPALALARGDGCRILIADAVGMGKTVQAALIIADALQRHPDGRALVVTPAGLREQWRDELGARFALDAEVLDAAGIARTDARIPSGMNPWSVHRLAIASIDYVKRPEVIRCHEALLWDVVVFDEAHGLAGRSDRAAAADALARRARTVVMLTATPHSGDDEAFRRMCRIGRLANDAPLLMFRRTRADAGIEAARRTTMLRVRPSVAERAMHDALLDYARLVWHQPAATAAPGARLAVSVLMRRASSSATSLARSLERRLELIGTARPHGFQASLPFGGGADDEEPGVVLAVPGLPDEEDERARLEHLLSLARAAARSESKLRVLRRFLARVHEPAIVFTEYRDTLERLADVDRDDETVRLHGGLTQRERADVLHRFTSGQAALLLATDAASEGLNLHQRCRLIVNLELPWTPLRLEQRAGRVDRIGQRRQPHAVHLVASGTGEEQVLARLAVRLARMQRAMNSLAGVPDERDVAESVIGGRALPEAREAPTATSMDDIAVVSLSSEARLEAARLAAARALVDSDDNGVARAVIARVDGRKYRSHPQRCYWVFRALLAAREGMPREAAFAIHATAARRHRHATADIRRLLDPARPELQRAVDAAAAQCLQATRDGLTRRAAPCERREQALAAELRERQARLAAGLLQPGLFDRRSERAAASQASLLEQALAGSAVRMAELAALETLAVDSCELLFAVSLG